MVPVKIVLNGNGMINGATIESPEGAKSIEVEQVAEWRGVPLAQVDGTVTT